MEVVDALVRCGGVASAATLRRATSQHRLRRAVLAGDVVRDARGRYALPVTDEAVRAAHRLTATLSHRSAALSHGWEVRTVPRLPEIVVPRGRNVDARRRATVDLRWRRLRADEVELGSPVSRTSPIRTVLDCAADLSFAEALSVADSALRHGDVGRGELVAAADLFPSRAAAMVASLADGRAANPFESSLRAVARGVTGLRLEPQVVVPGIGRPDLLDRSRRIVVEAESFEWHGARTRLERDCRRYNAFVIDGWLVVRFSWEQVMFEPEYVVEVLTALVAATDGRSRRRGTRRTAA